MKETQIFLLSKFPSLICLQVLNFSYNFKDSTSAIRVIPRERQSISRLATHAAWLLFLLSLLQVTSSNTAAQILSQVSLTLNILSLWTYHWILLLQSPMSFMWSNHRKNVALFEILPPILKSTEISGTMEREVIIISSVASPEPRIVTLDSDSNDPTIPYGFGNQQPIVSPSPNDLTLPPNSFNVLATMAVIRADDTYSPQSPEPSIPSPIWTPPMNVSTLDDWDTTYNTTDDATVYTSDEPRKVYWDISTSDTFDCNEPRNVSVASSTSSTPPPPRRQKEIEHRDVFCQKGGSVAAHLRGMRPTLTSQKDTLMLRRNSNIIYSLLDFNYIYIMYFNCCAYIRIRI